MSTKEPWNNEIYRAMKEESTEMKRHDRGKEESKRPLTTRFLTFLVVLMFILVGFAIGFILWNNQVRNTASIAKSFHQSSASKSEQASSQVPASSSTEASTPASSSTAASSSSSSSEAADTYTYTIATGDYPSTIAAKTGIPWATIASLNGISADGYNADGSAIHAGQIFKLK
ncbi:SAG1386/EF1546 family surface-associated protein [Lactococcus cremoris]|uniref:SAG1386/EF1546 family surface-associated protein n=1 Tax=Lactococcus lactis subsp. cremoris TaxID=1359 RepID=UPI00223A9D7A|nr:SAG1386/EF1546 family surface-associated protein [Lactococcus cremoris]MCT0488217.1 LysM peptidoglycan-binding domain-containing protein [Lactococcus cremoris]